MPDISKKSSRLPLYIFGIFLLYLFIISEAFWGKEIMNWHFAVFFFYAKFGMAWFIIAVLSSLITPFVLLMTPSIYRRLRKRIPHTPTTISCLLLIYFMFFSNAFYGFGRGIINVYYIDHAQVNGKNYHLIYVGERHGAFSVYRCNFFIFSCKSIYLFHGSWHEADKYELQSNDTVAYAVKKKIKS